MKLNEKEIQLLKQLVFLYLTNPEIELDPELEDVLLKLLYKLEWNEYKRWSYGGK